MSKNYEEMSDFEINKKVGSTLGIHIDEEKTKSFVDMAERLECNDGSAFFSDGEFHNYCNNPSDAWPIIVSNEIDIIHNGMGCALATDNAIDLIKGSDRVIFFQDENPLRSAMICFLMMKDGEQ